MFFSKIENVERVFDVVVRYDVRKSDAGAILYGDTRCKKNGHFIVLAAFSDEIRVKVPSNKKITLFITILNIPQKHYLFAHLIV